VKTHFLPCLAGITLAVSLLSVTALADDGDKEIDADVQRGDAAIKANSADVSVELLYKPFLDAIGMTRDQMKKLASAEMQKMAAQRIKIVRCDPVLPYKHFSTTANDYALITLHEEMWVGLDCYELTDPELAIRPHGSSKWEYLSLGKLSPELKERLFPDLKNINFPSRTIIKVL
jgi:hypothetical protein